MNIEYWELELADVNFEVSVLEEHWEYVKEEYERLKEKERDKYREKMGGFPPTPMSRAAGIMKRPAIFTIST